MARNVPLRGLRAFCVVARHSSIKNAADEMCVTASAVSHQIKDLERRLGIKLFERSTRLLTITANGRGLFEEIDPLIRNIDRATGRWARQTDASSLRVRLPAFFASELFLPKFRMFADSQPEMDFSIETTESDRGSHRPGADISVVMADSPPSDPNVEPLFDVRLAPATSPEVSRQLQHDKPTFPDGVNLIVHSDYPRAWHEWAEEAAVELLTPKRFIRFDTTAGVTSAAEKGLGVALVPMPVAEARFDAGKLVRVADQDLNTGDRYYMVYELDDGNRQSIQSLRSWILGEFGSVSRRPPVTQSGYHLHQR